MEFNLDYETNLLYSNRHKIQNIILNKFLFQLGRKTDLRFSSEFFLLCYTTKHNGYISISIDEEKEIKFINNLDRFLEIQNILNKIIFETYSNKLKKFDKKKNIKIEIKIKGVIKKWRLIYNLRWI